MYLYLLVSLFIIEREYTMHTYYWIKSLSDVVEKS